MTTPPASGKHAGVHHKDEAAGAQPDQHLARRTRIGGIWVASALFALVLLLLLIFILENGQKVDISYFGAHGHLPRGVALLLAAVLGVLLVVIPGAGRILQLRVVARRYRKLGNRQAREAPPAAPAVAPGSAVTSADAGPVQAEGTPAGTSGPAPAGPAPSARGAAGTAGAVDAAPIDQGRP
jgi:uncharacterized integral membrane protein